MDIKNGRTFEKVYERYLAWFHEKADAEARPKGKDEVLQCQRDNEDVFEDSSILLSRAFFFVPLLPSESKSGRLEVFTLFELNLMRKSGGPDGDDLEEAVPVEYGNYTT